MIFDQIDKFAGYGFNKSHAAAYALIAYQTAYLKANYPVEFFAAAMNFELGDTDKLNVFRRNWRAIASPCCRPISTVLSRSLRSRKRMANPSSAMRSPPSKASAMAAMQVRGRGARRQASLKDLFDFSERVDPRMSLNRKQMENLA